MKQTKKAAWIPLTSSPERDALCERLGINVALYKASLKKQRTPPKPTFGTLAHLSNQQPASELFTLWDDTFIWSMIGQELAKSQPEFTGGKGKKGRPRLGEKLPGIDYQRYAFIRALQRELEPLDGKQRYKNQRLIEMAVESGSPLFRVDMGTLTESVRKGAKVWKKAERRCQRQMAEWLRSDSQRLRKRKAWLDEAREDVARLEHLNSVPYFGLLSPEGNEAYALRARLHNPFRLLRIP